MTKTIELQLQSPRLYLQPLTYEQLLLYKDHDNLLETELGVSYGGILTPEFKWVIETSNIPYVKLYPHHLYFGTVWIIILKERKLIIGDVGFKGAPSDQGLLEVGYGIFTAHRNMGYMAEALKLITGWAFSLPEVKIILAETDKSNIASQRTLTRNSFSPFAETEVEYWWRLDKEPINELKN